MKAYLDAYNSATQAVTAGTVLTTTVADVSGGLCILDNGSSYVLRGAGVYYVTVTATAAPTAAGDMGIQLLNNGTNVTGAIATEDTAAGGDFVNLSFSKLIRVLPSCCAVNNKATLTVQATAAGNVTNYNIVILRIA